MSSFTWAQRTAFAPCSARATAPPGTRTTICLAFSTATTSHLSATASFSSSSRSRKRPGAAPLTDLVGTTNRFSPLPSWGVRAPVTAPLMKVAATLSRV